MKNLIIIIKNKLSFYHPFFQQLCLVIFVIFCSHFNNSNNNSFQLQIEDDENHLATTQNLQLQKSENVSENNDDSADENDDNNELYSLSDLGTSFKTSANPIIRICRWFYRIFLPIALFCGCIFRYNFISFSYLVLLLIAPNVPAFIQVHPMKNKDKSKSYSSTSANNTYPQESNSSNTTQINNSSSQSSKNNNNNNNLPTKTPIKFTKSAEVFTWSVLFVTFFTVLIQIVFNVTLLNSGFEAPNIVKLSDKKKNPDIGSNCTSSQNTKNYFGLYRLDQADTLNVCRLILPDLVIMFISVATIVLHRTAQSLDLYDYDVYDTGIDEIIGGEKIEENETRSTNITNVLEQDSSQDQPLISNTNNNTNNCNNIIDTFDTSLNPTNRKNSIVNENNYQITQRQKHLIATSLRTQARYEIQNYLLLVFTAVAFAFAGICDPSLLTAPYLLLFICLTAAWAFMRKSCKKRKCARR